MGRCFVIQPFDRGKFDKRYEDVFVPAIAAAGLEPYRVDKDPAVTIPIDEIEAGLGSAEVCLVDITADNPNVWFELGLAIGLRRLAVLVCSDERNSPFPFDVQHRTIVRYSTESSSDFQRLRDEITQRLLSLLKQRDQLSDVAQLDPASIVQGLQQHEIAALVAIASANTELDEGASAYQIKQGMDEAGFTKVAGTLALRGLLAQRMITSQEARDHDGSTYKAYVLSDTGLRWLQANQGTLVLRKRPSPPPDLDSIPF